MAFIGLCCRGDYRLWQAFVLTEAFRQSYTTDFTCAGGIVAPCAACKVTTYNHLDLEAFTTAADCDHGVW
jgi:hypothetical protein